VTLDQNYVQQLKVLITSVYINNPGEIVNLYVIHSKIPEYILKGLSEDLIKLKYNLYPIRVSEENFVNAPITNRYPVEMYYRLLAYKWLPNNIDKILYLDPDILVINPIDGLWNLDISDFLFAAASHTGKTEVSNNVNRIRLGIDTDYYNSGVLLMNLKKCREEIVEEDIYEAVSKHADGLFLPDQDVLNILYCDKIKEIDDVIWNYDARNYSNYMLRSVGEANMDWVLKNTSILHFCGREKPWKKNYQRRFGILYKHYQSLTNRYLSVRP